MLIQINPKLPMRDKNVTRDFYVNKLRFEQYGGDFDGYLMVEKDNIQIHFFEHTELNPKENYGQVYIRTDDIDSFFKSISNIGIKTTGLAVKPWGQKEFSIIDPDHNLLTFGQNTQ